MRVDVRLINQDGQDARGVFDAVADTPLPGTGAHAYFEALRAHPAHWRSYSLRDQAQLNKYSQKKPAVYPPVTYDPANDTYHTPQDAAKVVIASDSLQNQVRLPLELIGGSALITWDAWWGREYITNRGQLVTHKTFQIASAWDGSARFIEIRNQYTQGGVEHVSDVDIRSYWPSRPPASLGPNGRQLPMVGTFKVKPQTWTRYFAFWESNPTGGDAFSLWVADEISEPVQLYDRIAQDAKDETLIQLWIEFNSSSTRDVAFGPLTAYVRNVVVLRNVADPRALFQRPV